ncbi:retinoblastoma-related protein isoform X1 [Aristolochia californica]|uniref:retinoblastoma-related protein isoform X1 n=1 Tax=Aristolochia californica TaxID=171875 RepID=UPI0035DCB85F
MEDAKTLVSSSNSESGDGRLESRFANLCKSGLTLDENTSKQAMALLDECKPALLEHISSTGSVSSDKIERSWFACVLYSVKRLSDAHKSEKVKHEKGESELELCQILRATMLNVVDFYGEVPKFVLKAGHILTNMFGTDWEKQLKVKEMQVNFVHLCILSNYYRQAYMKFFSTDNAKVDAHPSLVSCTARVSDYHRFGWLLFLSLRVHAFSRFRDLVTCTVGLVSILAILILHVPVRFRKLSICDPQLFVKKGERGVDIISSLCNIYHTSEDELKGTIEKANSLIVDILKKEPRSASECKAENLENIVTDGLTYFEDLLEGESLPASLLALEKDYDDATHNTGELDERLFSYEEEASINSWSLSGGSMDACGSKRKFDELSSPAKTITSSASPPCSPAASPANGSFGGTYLKMAPTPVSTAMTTAKWLRTVISPLPSKPSAELERYFSSCDKDVTNDVIRRTHIILQAIFPSSHGEQGVAGMLRSVTLMDTIWAEQRRMEALKLYYRVLESMCRAESSIVQGGNLTSLLSNERFHRCMLACSADLVLATHKSVIELFPAVLEGTGITAFDLSKVIESFVRHEESLPRELKRYLNSLEERLLESMVWEKGSSMYNSLIVARPSLAAEINRLGLLAEPMPSLDAIAMHHNIPSVGLPPLPHLLPKHEVSADQNGDAQSPKRACNEFKNALMERNSFTPPLKERLLGFSTPKSKFPRPLQSAFASPTHPNPAGGGETCAETGIQVLFSKIVKLAAIRIKSLCERLQLSQQVLESVYCLIQQILSQRTALFFNRHIDQLILCSFYGVAKISQLSLTFKEIIYNYRKQPYGKPHVFRSVFVNWQSTGRNGRTGQEHVDIITFYNEVFVPTVKPLLVELGPSGATLRTNRVPEDHNNTDGQCPQSPRLTPFPSLPDMSPKKVSVAHNVYVSPLRSSKMDALISPSSNSSYACVGESTHAYQSPSKDLSDINNRLNGSRENTGFYTSGRKVNMKLNFDAGLVSDSMVARSLYPQNGSSASPGAATPLKCEQADP